MFDQTDSVVNDILVGGNEEIEICLSPLQQLTVSNTTPALGLDGGTDVVSKQVPHWPRNTLIKKNSHAAESKACSERSSTLQTDSRVSEGKHSRISSNE